MKSLENQAGADRMKRAGQRANAYPALEHSDLAEGDRAMSRCAYNGDSTPDCNSENSVIASLLDRIEHLEAKVAYLSGEKTGSIRASTVRKFVAEVSKEYAIPANHILGPSRIAEVVEARQEVMRRAHAAGVSFSRIGRDLGGRDHTTIIHGVRRAEERIMRDGKVANLNG